MLEVYRGFESADTLSSETEGPDIKINASPERIAQIRVSVDINKRELRSALGDKASIKQKKLEILEKIDEARLASGI